MAPLLPLLTSLVTLASSANAFFILNSRVLVSSRVDSIVNPGGISGHVHDVVGGQRFGSTYSHDDSVASSCTTVPVTVDKSNYWAPAAYYVNATTGQYHKMKSGYNIYYLFRNGPKGAKIHAFPKGLRMLAGNPMARTFDPNSHASKAVSYVCLNYAKGSPQTEKFPEEGCPNGLRIQIFFPSCWDGKNLDSPDHKSHMAYPIQNFDSGDCPATHPVQLVSLFFEHIVDSGSWPFNGPGKTTWVLSTGDETGYSNHGDFTNGWDVDLLQRAIDTCDDRNGVLENCAVLRPFIDNAAKEACMPVKDQPLEDVGFWGPLNALPGDNQRFGANRAKVPTVPPPPVPVFGPVDIAGARDVLAQAREYLGNGGGSPPAPNPPAQNPPANPPSGGNPNPPNAPPASDYPSEGDGSNGNAPASPPVCAADSPRQRRRDARNVRRSLEMMELAARAAAPEPEPVPSVKFGFNDILSRRAAHVHHAHHVARNLVSEVAPSSLEKRALSIVPAAWKPAGTGCAAEANSGRALSGASFTSNTMDRAKCTAFCDSKGFKFAGVEFSTECYCGHFINGAQLAAKECNYQCAGNVYQTCGAARKLTVFAKA